VLSLQIKLVSKQQRQLNSFKTFTSPATTDAQM
jgi:hypothetical protein